MRYRIAAYLAGCVAAFLMWYSFGPETKIVQGDHCSYVLQAERLIAGKPYDFYHPRGYSLLLTIPLRIAGRNERAMSFWNVVAVFAAVLGIFYLWNNRHAGALALAATAVGFVAPAFWRAGTTIDPHTPAFAAGIWMLVAGDKFLKTGKYRFLVLHLALVWLAMLIRYAYQPILYCYPLVLLFSLLRGDKRRVRTIGVLALLLPVIGLGVVLTSGDYVRFVEGQPDASDVWSRTLTYYYQLAATRFFIFPEYRSTAGTVAGTILVILPMLVGLAYRLRRGIFLTEIFTGGYILQICQMNMTENAYAFPALIVLNGYWVFGMWRIARRVLAVRRRKVGYAVTLILAAAALAPTIKYDLWLVREQRAVGMYFVERRDFANLLPAISQLPPGARIAVHDVQTFDYHFGEKYPTTEIHRARDRVPEDAAYAVFFDDNEKWRALLSENGFHEIERTALGWTLWGK